MHKKMRYQLHQHKKKKTFTRDNKIYEKSTSKLEDEKKISK